MPIGSGSRRPRGLTSRRKWRWGRHCTSRRPLGLLILESAAQSIVVPGCLGNRLAGGLGFEPRLAESESAVLPLDDPPPAWPRAPFGGGGRRGGASGLSRRLTITPRPDWVGLIGGPGSGGHGASEHRV